jgi:hypothetical protein
MYDGHCIPGVEMMVTRQQNMLKPKIAQQRIQFLAKGFTTLAPSLRQAAVVLRQVFK